MNVNAQVNSGSMWESFNFYNVVEFPECTREWGWLNVVAKPWPHAVGNVASVWQYLVSAHRHYIGEWWPSG